MKKEKKINYSEELEKHYKVIQRKLYLIWFFYLIFPICFFLVSYSLKKNSFTNLVENYEEGIFRIIQYILFFIGVGIAFFYDGITNFLWKKNFQKDISEEKLLIRYKFYLFYILFILDLIGLSGFIGFLICGNIMWLEIFVILNVFLVFKCFPSFPRFLNMIYKKTE